MSLAKPQQFISKDDFLDGERISEVKHELIDGQAYAMAGASINHQRIVGNIFGEFRAHLKGSKCEAVSSDMLVNIGEDFFYPDVLVDCDFDQSKPYYTQTPVIIVEVLSKSTRRRDLTTKRLAYKTIPTLIEYVLVEQDFVNVEVLRKSSNWQGTHYVLGDEIYFESIDLTLTVEDIYERVQNDDMSEFLQARQNEG